MTIAFYGIDSELQIPDEANYRSCGAPKETPLDDPVFSLRAALADPLSFPPLAATVVEGDRIAIVLGRDLVQTSELVAGAVLELLEAGTAPESIVIVRTASDGEREPARPTQLLPEELRDRIGVVIHDPDDRENLAMLNVSKQRNEPIYLNRVIVEADVVLPIGVARPTGSLGDIGIHGVIFPTFSDAETQARFASPKTLDAEERQLRIDEAQEAVWYLGTRLVVQVVPGADDKLLHILAGDTDVTDRRSRELCDAVWCFEVKQREPLVVATVPAGPQRQTWDNLARALDAALRVVKHDGTIAVCCDLSDRLGKSLSRLVDVHSLDAIQGKVYSDTTPDAISAAQLIRAMQNANVFLLSKLDEECVHSLGMGFVSQADEVPRLASRFDSFMLLENAHQAIPTVSTEPALSSEANT